MNIISVTDPKYPKDNYSQIDCIITCEKGTFPFTARMDDIESYGRQLFSDLQSGKYGAIAPYGS